MPLGGLWFAGWSPATALTLYWFENAVGVALVALRIALHRSRTGKRGHYRRHLGLEISGKLRVAGRAEPIDVQPTTLLAEFLWSGVVFTAAHGVFLWLLLGLVLHAEPSRDELRSGVLAMATFQILGLAYDLPSLAQRPFAWVKGLAERSLGRVVLIHLAILGGALLSFGRPHPERFFLVFGALKLAADLASWLPLEAAPPHPERPPRYAAWLASLAPRTDESFADYWRRTTQQHLEQAASDEEPLRERS